MCSNQGGFKALILFIIYLRVRGRVPRGRCKKAEAVLGLGLYGTTAEECLTLLEGAAEALRQARPDGWTVKRLTCGETAYDQDCGRFVRRGELTAETFLYAIADETGAFLEFEVRGELNT